MLHLIVLSGLCNRLFAIISGMRYCRNTQQSMTIYWLPPVARVGLPYTSSIFKMEHLNCFFQPIPDITLKTWVPNLVKQLEKEYDANMVLDGSLIIPKFMVKDVNGNVIFPDNFMELMKKPLKIKRIRNPIINMPTSPFGFEEDPMEKYRSYPNQVGQVRIKDQYEKELSKFARKLKLIASIQNIINFQYRHIFSPFTKKKVGIHIRRTDLKTKITSEELDQTIQKIKDRFPDHIIFICSDDYELQQKYVRLHGFKAYQNPTKVDNNLQGVQKALVDLYLLSCCDYIFGTRHSSFSYYAWILSSDNTTFEI